MKLGSLATLALLSLPAGAQTTWYVDVLGTPPGTGTAVDPFTSIRYAIGEPQVADGDTLLVAPGTYPEALDLMGKTLVLRSTAGAAATVVDAGGLGSALTLAGGEGPATTIEGFTFTGGAGTTEVSTGAVRGGGVYLLGTSPRLAGCVVRDNTLGGGLTDQGAGLYSGGGSPALVDCVFERNQTWGDGGGAALIGGAPQVLGCRFEDNDAGGYGGGAFLDAGAPSVVDSNFVGNVSTWSGGGGIACRLASAQLIDSAIEGNASLDGDGGGLFVDFGGTVRMFDCALRSNSGVNWRTGGGAFVAGGRLELYRGVVEGNDSYRGGGIASWGELHLEGVALRGNVAASTSSEPNDGNGGGVWVAPSATPATLVQCQIEANAAYNDAYWGGFGGGVHGPAVLDRCTVVGNQAAQGGGAVHAVQELVSSIVRDNLPASFPDPIDGTSWSNVEGGAPGTGNIDEDPLFWHPAGGDWRLQPGSPCIDAGDPLAPLDPDGSVADMGAHPFDPGYCPAAEVYCTAGSTSSGCQAALSTLGAPSASAGSGFVVLAGEVEGGVQGLFFWGRSAQALPWQGGSSTLCVAAPQKRTGVQSSGGTPGACNGTFALDFNGWMQANPAKAPQVGERVYLQAWFRDPPSPGQTSLSDAVSFSICP